MEGSNVTHETASFVIGSGPVLVALSITPKPACPNAELGIDKAD